MLKQLKIKNIAIIDECTIEFGHGFNVLSGETGAGKSIIIDSLEFVLGARADKTLIKSGEDAASVTAVFDLSDVPQNEEIFKLLGLEEENILVVSRIMNLQGKNECRVNGEITSVSVLKKITYLLVNIFGQHDSVVLLDSKNHLDMLDDVDEDSLLPLKNKLNLLLDEIKNIDSQIASLGGLGEERIRNIDILKYQIDEIAAANLQEDEEQELEVKLKKLQDREKIADLINSSLGVLNGDYNISSAIKAANSNLELLEHYDELYSDLKKRLQSVKYEVEDVVSTLEEESSGLEYSENDLNAVIDRLEVIKDLKRKYGSSISDVLSYLENAQNRLDLLLNAEVNIVKLTDKKKTLCKDVFEVSQELTKKRKLIADKLQNNVVLELKELGMKNAKFVVNFEEYNSSNIMDIVSSNGADNVEFLFSANLGVPVAPLSKIISGGEMSRFMLAFKCVAGGDNKTYVFDEIDAGIGGEVGTIVAKKISKIAKNAQVLCVTHLAQIACFGDNNYLIKKTESENKTTTNVMLLDANGKQQEITRMIGSVNSVEYASKHASELIKEAELIKMNNK